MAGTDPDEVLNGINIEEVAKDIQTPLNQPRNRGGRPPGSKDTKPRKNKPATITLTQAKKDPLSKTIDDLVRATLNGSILQNSAQWDEDKFTEKELGAHLMVFMSKYAPLDLAGPGWQVALAFGGVAVGTYALRKTPPAPVEPEMPITPPGLG